MERQKRAAAIHDISGFGRCSLTVALPIISAAGVETSVIPTAVLSTHTGGLSGYTYRDLTEDLKPFADHWKSLGLTFDAIYSGFLGSFRQLDIVSEIFDELRCDDTLILVDPVMADHGEMYKVFSRNFVAGMRGLCKKADIITPNITEACFMLDMPYKKPPHDEKFIGDIMRGLLSLGVKAAVLTGVSFDRDTLGAACIEAGSTEMHYVCRDRVEGFYHGTGDVFASVLLAALLRAKSLPEAADIAVGFTADSIKRTKAAGTDVRFGVNFEAGLYELMGKLR
ncbi:MAG: pyridoxamine kinase [Clostridia bacterium]|nr:pyridoxamine kinase [Clostridia bacterium]